MPWYVRAAIWFSLGWSLCTIYHHYLRSREG